MKGSSGTAEFMPQLDGLRGLAVLGVLVHHYLEAPPLLPFLDAEAGNWGLLGVRLFFVLSGFLITAILLRSRQLMESGAASLRGVLTQFYLRRGLRIFPLYYLVLLGAWLLGGPEVREQLPWLATYSYNFWITSLGWYTAHFSHFWSLAVEEQFYLLWPAVILLVPRRFLIPLLLTVAASAPFYRALCLELELNGLWFYVLPPPNLDALAGGSLLALAAGGRLPGRELTSRLLPLGGCALAGWLLTIQLPTASVILSETLMSICFVALVAGAAVRFDGPARLLLEARPLMYLGKISYGIYVFHLFIPDLGYALMARAGVAAEFGGLGYFTFFTLVTVAVASLSWYAFEKPINGLKKRYETAAAPPVPVSRLPD